MCILPTLYLTSAPLCTIAPPPGEVSPIVSPTTSVAETPTATGTGIYVKQM